MTWCRLDGGWSLVVHVFRDVVYPQSCDTRSTPVYSHMEIYASASFIVCTPPASTRTPPSYHVMPYHAIPYHIFVSLTTSLVASTPTSGRPLLSFSGRAPSASRRAISASSP